jgi:outer membrane protein assembly factor BamB
MRLHCFPSRLLALSLALLPTIVGLSPAVAADWVHWRGPEQDGVSRDKNLPETFNPNGPAGQGNVIWKQPYGGRSTPLILKGRLYMVSGYDMAKPTEGERVVCFDAETGEKKWEQRFNVFHTDIVSSRLGWTSLTADPDKELIYCHTTAGFLICYDKDGKEIWKRQLTEEFGRVSGYGGRISNPIFDSGVVIAPIVSSGWGDQARGANRFIAFDGETGKVAWVGDTPYPISGTYYSNPIIAVVNGQRQMIAGGADGRVHGFNVRTGERLWSYEFSAGVVNPSPVIDGNLIYICHGEENPEGGTIGRIICLDVSQIDKETKKPKLVWEQKKLAKRFGLASPALADGLLYMAEDAAEMYCFDAKTGRPYWKEKYGTVARGAPLIADGKMYVFDVNAKMMIFGLNGKDSPEIFDEIPFRRTTGPGFVETNGTPIAVNGKLYFLTQDNLYCVGLKDAKSAESTAKELTGEPVYKEDAAPAGLRIFPADVTTVPGQDIQFEVKFLDSVGRVVKAPAGAEVEWSLPLPPKTPTGAQPPALNGEMKPSGVMATVITGKVPAQQGYVSAKFGNLTAGARVRVAAQPPYTADFEKTPVGAGPSGWVNASPAKYIVKEFEGSKVLSKTNTNSRPPFARANGYITEATASDYTIQADVYGTLVRGRLPDIGLVNSRYTLIMDSKTDSASGKRPIRIVSWEARPRINEAADFDWQPSTWYTLKLSVEPSTGTVRAKAWKKGDAEPEKWMIEFKDPSPNTEGAAAVYGYIPDPSITQENPGSDAYFDNVVITPNAKK